MDPQTVLRLGIRILGLVFLYHALMAMPRLVVQILRLATNFQIEALLSSLLACAWPLLLAIWFLRGAPQLGRWVASGDGDRSS